MFLSIFDHPNTFLNLKDIHHSKNKGSIKSNNLQFAGGGWSQILFHRLLHTRDGILIGPEPGHGLSILIHNELSEVPLDCIDQKTRLFFLEKHPQGVSLGPIDVNFGKHIKLEKSYNAVDIGMYLTLKLYFEANCLIS